MTFKQFPRRPETIKAIQYTGIAAKGGSFEDMVGAINNNQRIQINEKTNKFEVLTNHGWAVVEYGDWIIQRDDGELYPCKDEVFQKLVYIDMEIPEYLPEHMKRVFVEQTQLQEKITALNNYIKAGQPKASKEEAIIQQRQLGHMVKYIVELFNRLQLYKE